jgi:hypothetical protein
MAGSVDGIRAKIERAKEHIRDLDIAKKSFFETDPYKILSKFQPEFGDKGQTIHYVSVSNRIPIRIALIAGDAIHNLRTALDQLTVQLGLVSGLSEAECAHLYFPICESAEKYKTDSPRKVKGIRNVIVQAINDAEPYKGGTEHGDVLWSLHKLDITDKHRLLITVGCSLKKWGIPVVWEEVKTTFPDLPNEIMGHGTEVAWFEPVPDRHSALEPGHMIFAINGKDNTKFEFVFDISFAEIEIVESKPIVETLSAMANVVENLVADFTPFLL